MYFNILDHLGARSRVWRTDGQTGRIAFSNIAL